MNTPTQTIIVSHTNNRDHEHSNTNRNNNTGGEQTNSLPHILYELHSTTTHVRHH